jgi:virginiamycin A acetyltransferase
MHGPDPATRHPLTAHPRVGFLKPLVSAPNVEIGEYTYYDDPDGPELFVEKCVRHHYQALGDRLVIGRFCALATGVQFVMNGANHAMDAISTYPFDIFAGGWEAGFDAAAVHSAASKGDTIVGNDVWIGGEAMILPGVTIGDGAIVGTRAVVARDVPPYAIVVGNPARVVKLRFPETDIQRLLAIRWWDWDATKITHNLDAIRGNDIAALENAS